MWVTIVALLVVRAVAIVHRGTISDITWASVGGAQNVMAGLLPYGGLPDVGMFGHGDTYGPLMYVAYVPATFVAEHLSPIAYRIRDAGEGAALTYDVAVAGTLALAAWNLAGRRAAACAALLWVAFPATTYAAANATNEAVPALLVAAALAFIRFPFVRGLFVGLAASAKLVPLMIAAPLLHLGRQARLRQSLLVVAGVGVPLLLSASYIAWYVDGPRLFWHAVIDYQLSRPTSDLSSLWAMHHVEGARKVASLVALLFIGLTAIFPRTRTIPQAMAGVVVTLALVQLVATHWWMPYATWFWPAMAVLVATGARDVVVAAAEPVGEASTVEDAAPDADLSQDALALAP
jgi:hypothetical protein